MLDILSLITAMVISISKISQAHSKNNFLFVIVDDLRPALGCYGDTKAYTPNIDRLAQQSVTFYKAYAQQSLCAPSRNSLLTSRRPDSLGLYDFYSYWRNVTGNYTTIPEHLKNNGYVTQSMGKIFHPGASCNYNDDSPYSWSETPFHPDTDRYKDAPVCSEKNSLPANNLICPVHVPQMPNATLPDIETLKAAKTFLKKKKNQPFFLAIGFHKPHIPLKYPKRYLKFHPLSKFSLPNNYAWPVNVSHVAYNPWMDLRWRTDVEKLGLQCPWQKIPNRYAKKIIQSYYAAVTYIDDLIGELLNELEILKIRNNTIIILTSDHGWSLGEHSEWAKYSNFEVALRVPLMISIPKTFTSYDVDNLPIEIEATKNKIVYNPVELLDVFPTIADLAGFPIPKCPSKKFDSVVPNLCSEGSSLIPLIEASSMHKPITWKKAAISQYPRPGMHPSCKESSDRPRLRKIHIMGYSLRTIRYRYTAWVRFSSVFKNPSWQEILAEELYDHSVDYEENFNVANLHTFQQIKNDLKRLLIND